MPPLSSKPEPTAASIAVEYVENLKPSPVLRLHLDELSHPGTQGGVRPVLDEAMTIHSRLSDRLLDSLLKSEHYMLLTRLYETARESCCQNGRLYNGRRRGTLRTALQTCTIPNRLERLVVFLYIPLEFTVLTSTASASAPGPICDFSYTPARNDSHIYATATPTFLSLIDSARLLPNAISNIVKYLYVPLRTAESHSNVRIPPTRSVTLILRSMDGVAYTTGIALDDAHKEIHLNLNYAAKFISEPARFREELIGVVTHEMVHAYQWNGLGTANGGLIEGIADFVRLKAGLAPPHWKRDEKVERWDEGYQRTAYFLEYLEEEYGNGTVARINAELREKKYEKESFWTGIFGEGKDVEWLFKRYRETLRKEGEDRGDGKKEEEKEAAAIDDGVLVELEDAEKMVVQARFDTGSDGKALR